MGAGLYEVRTALPTKRIARVMVTVFEDRLVALHGFIKKSQSTPITDLTLTRKRQKDLHHE
jgi:phage-related protein